MNETNVNTLLHAMLYCTTKIAGRETITQVDVENCKNALLTKIKMEKK